MMPLPANLTGSPVLFQNGYGGHYPLPQNQLIPGMSFSAGDFLGTSSFQGYSPYDQWTAWDPFSYSDPFSPSYLDGSFLDPSYSDRGPLFYYDASDDEDEGGVKITRETNRASAGKPCVNCREENHSFSDVTRFFEEVTWVTDSSNASRDSGSRRARSTASRSSSESLRRERRRRARERSREERSSESLADSIIARWDLVDLIPGNPREVNGNVEGPYNSLHYKNETFWNGVKDTMANRTSGCAFKNVLKEFEKLCTQYGTKDQCRVQWGNFYRPRDDRSDEVQSVEHDTGRCVDVRPFNKSGRVGGQSVYEKATYHSNYNPDKTRLFARAVTAAGATVLFGDRSFRGDRMIATRWIKEQLEPHENHMHICFDPNSIIVKNSCDNGVDLDGIVPETLDRKEKPLFATGEEESSQKASQKEG
jgi:hypothetical protein